MRVDANLLHRLRQVYIVSRIEPMPRSNSVPTWRYGKQTYPGSGSGSHIRGMSISWGLISTSLPTPGLPGNSTKLSVTCFREAMRRYYWFPTPGWPLETLDFILLLSSWSTTINFPYDHNLRMGTTTEARDVKASRTSGKLFFFFFYYFTKGTIIIIIYRQYSTHTITPRYGVKGPTHPPQRSHQRQLRAKDRAWRREGEYYYFSFVFFWY